MLESIALSIDFSSQTVLPTLALYTSYGLEFVVLVNILLVRRTFLVVW
jgi:hypothetical protein